jgi:glycosyltransferase involved in cell wall biosynthesis
MRILWLNWRDLKSPDAGGAEVFTHEVAKRLVCMGYDVSIFCARYPNSTDSENVEGVKIIRSGSRYSVYKNAKQFYKSNKDKFDLIIDEINTRPFLTPKYVKDKPILALIHQLAQEFWFFETRFPLNYIGFYYLEKKWLSYYKDIPTVTVSNSSRQDIQSLGFKYVTVVPEGLSIKPLNELVEKESDPTVIFIGRLKKAKMPDHAVKAFSQIKREIPNAKMWIIGDGYMLQKLRKMDYSGGITFYGRVSNELKYDLLSRAHLVLVPAVREGWGLVVTEANAMGTPVIAYNVPGLRDSVINKTTGILVADNTPNRLGRSAVSLLRDKGVLKRLSVEALEFSRKFSWDNTAKEFGAAIKNAVESYRNARMHERD